MHPDRILESSKASDIDANPTECCVVCHTCVTQYDSFEICGWYIGGCFSVLPNPSWAITGPSELFSKLLHADAILGRNVGPGCFCSLFTSGSSTLASQIAQLAVTFRRASVTFERPSFTSHNRTCNCKHEHGSNNPISRNPICHATSVTFA